MIPLILLVILISLMVLHITQYQFSWIKIKPLWGYYEDAAKSKFTWESWFSGYYQETEEQYLTDHFGFRSFFVRLNHQWRFSLFHKIKAQKVILGKNNYLYEKSYIDCYYGDEFSGRDLIENRMHKLKLLQDTLQQLGKTIVVVLAPGKGSFYPEYIPEQFHKEPRTTNISVYREYIEKWNINCMDFNQYFIDIKEVSPYPLYPQLGIHWSIYGSCLVADSMVRYIERKHNITMPHIYWDEIKIAPPDEYDRDVSRSLNLLFTPQTMDLAYPCIQFETDSGKTKPSLLVIGDSFYWTIYYRGWPYYLFTDAHFWYYNKEIYSQFLEKASTTEDIILKDEILKRDIIIILCADSNLSNLGWGFIESGYDVFY